MSRVRSAGERVAERRLVARAPRSCVLVLCLACAVTGGVSSSALAKPPRQPNIVVIQSDDQTTAQVGSELMPKLNRLIVRRGVTLKRYFVSLPLCCPSRASLLTGRYAHNTGVRSNRTPLGGFARFKQGHTLPVWLRRAGYRTAHVGHYLNGYGNLPDRRQIPRGWDHWVGTPGGSAYRMYDYRLNLNGKLRRYGSAPADYQTDVVAERTESYLKRQRRGHPFFLAVDPLAPHSEVHVSPTPPCQGPRPAPRDAGIFASIPFVVPPSYNEPDVSDKPGVIADRPPLTLAQQEYTECSYRRQRESLPALDDLVAGVFRELRRRHLLSSTYVFYVSDNGFMGGEHRIVSGKDNPYMESVRVPAFVRGPGIKRGSSYRQLAANIDLAPTILSLAHARRRADRPIDGVSLASQLRGGKPKRGRRILLEYFDRFYWPPYVGLIDGRHSYWRYVDTGGKELYDYRRDPYQLENLARDPASARLVKRLQRRSAKLAKCSGRGCR